MAKRGDGAGCSGRPLFRVALAGSDCWSDRCRTSCTPRAAPHGAPRRCRAHGPPRPVGRRRIRAEPHRDERRLLVCGALGRRLRLCRLATRSRARGCGGKPPPSCCWRRSRPRTREQVGGPLRDWSARVDLARAQCMGETRRPGGPHWDQCDPPPPRTLYLSGGDATPESPLPWGCSACDRRHGCSSPPSWRHEP